MKKILAILLAASALSAVSAQVHERKLYNDGTIDYAPANTQIQLTAEDSETSIESITYTLDGSAETVYSNPITLTEEGRHVINYTATDNQGNRAAEKIYAIIIDDTPAYLSASVEGPFYTNANGESFFNNDSNFYLRAEDTSSGVDGIYAAIDNNNYALVGEDGAAFSMNNAKDGTYALKGYAVDNVGNVSDVLTLNYTLDNTAPVISITSADELQDVNGVLYTNKYNVFTISATDELSGVADVYVSIDGGAYARGDLELSLITSGEHTIAVRAEDYLGNASEASLSVSVDATAPTTGYSAIISGVRQTSASSSSSSSSSTTSSSSNSNANAR